MRYVAKKSEIYLRKVIYIYDMYETCMVSKYTNISFPDALVKEIDAVVRKGILGYQSRADLAKEAIRVFLRDLAQYEEPKKSKLKTK